MDPVHLVELEVDARGFHGEGGAGSRGGDAGRGDVGDVTNDDSHLLIY